MAAAAAAIIDATEEAGKDKGNVAGDAECIDLGLDEFDDVPAGFICFCELLPPAVCCTFGFFCFGICAMAEALDSADRSLFFGAVLVVGVVTAAAAAVAAAVTY